LPPLGPGLAAALPFTRMHSGFLLLLWFIAVASVQFLPSAVLGLVVATCLLLALGLSRARVVRLLRRVRVLAVAIVVLFGWFTPGEALLAEWPGLSPTREGVAMALVHVGRLVVVVSAVALLLERLPLERLVGGLYSLARPLRLIGLSARDVALRLLLVLRFVDASPRGAEPMHWKDWLRDEANDDALPPIQLVRERFGRGDIAAGCALIVFALGWGLV